MLEMGGRAGSCRAISILKGLLSSLGHEPEHIEFQAFPFQFPQNQKGRSFYAICWVPSEDPKMLHQQLWMKLQTLLGQSFPLLPPQALGEKQMAHKEMRRKELTAPRTHPIRSVWMQCAHGDQPKPRAQTAQQESGRQSRRARQSQQEGPSPGLSDKAQPLQRLRPRQDPDPKTNLLSDEGLR